MYCSNPFGGKSFESFRSAAEVNKHSRDSPMNEVLSTEPSIFTATYKWD